MLLLLRLPLPSSPICFSFTGYPRVDHLASPVANQMPGRSNGILNSRDGAWRFGDGFLAGSPLVLCLPVLAVCFPLPIFLRCRREELPAQFTKNTPDRVIPGVFPIVKGSRITLKLLQPFEQASISKGSFIRQGINEVLLSPDLISPRSVLVLETNKRGDTGSECSRFWREDCTV